MKLKLLVGGLGIIILILFGILIFVNPPKQSPSAPAVTTGVPVSISSPDSQRPIASPVLIAGTVTGGGWFFEGTFPAKILDANGDVLGTGPVSAIPPEAWTSTGTVPFAASISFSAPHSATGTLVIENDNPSGLPANARSFSMSVRFK